MHLDYLRKWNQIRISKKKVWNLMKLVHIIHTSSIWGGSGSLWRQMLPTISVIKRYNLWKWNCPFLFCYQNISINKDKLRGNKFLLVINFQSPILHTLPCISVSVRLPCTNNQCTGTETDWRGKDFHRNRSVQYMRSSTPMPLQGILRKKKLKKSY